MKKNTDRQEEGQSIILIAFAIIILMIFAVIAVDLAYGYVHRRGDQNAADAASLAGARELADIFNENDGSIPPGYLADSIKIAMNDLAERNGIEDTTGAPGDVANENVTGYFLNSSGSRITGQDGNPITINEGGYVDPNARGVEAIAQSVAPSFFGGIVGLDGLPIQADAAVVFEGDVCQMTCIAPIATLTMTFQTDDNGDGFPCYNIWDGSRQTGASGGTDPCAGQCLDNNTCSNSTSTTCHNDNQCNFGPCESGFCRQKQSIACTTSADGICSNNPYVSCHNTNNNGCDFGVCQNNACSLDGSVFCATNAECSGTCDPPYSPVCSVSSTILCEGDDDCPDGEYCEDDQGGHNSGLGWLNWSLQGADHSCRDVGLSSDCSEPCLEYNLTPDTCLSGMISVGDWVASTSGVKNGSHIRTLLQCYADLPPGNADPICTTPGQPITVAVYDAWHGNGCNQNQGAAAAKLAYHVVGFAEFKILGYELSRGSGSAAGYNGAGCEDWGMEGNRITGVFIGWVDGTPGDCETNGTITAPKMVK
jgi:hypothetical protein